MNASRSAIAGGLFAVLVTAPLDAPAAEPGAAPPLATEEAKRKADREAEETAKQCLAEFKKSLRAAKTVDDVARAVKTLDVRHPSILNQLLQLVETSSAESVQVAAVEALVRIDDPRCVAALNALLLARLGRVKESQPVCLALLKAAGHFGDARSAPSVAKAIGSNDITVAREACRAAGRVKDPLVVDELIAVLKKAEQPDDVYYVGGRTGAGWGQGETVKNPHRDLAEPIRESLKALTRQEYANARGWQQWWREHRTTWKPG